MRRGSSLGWIALIMAPFALLAKSLTLFSKAIGALFKPSPPRVHRRAPNYLLEDDVKRSRINLNKAKQGRIHASIALDRTKREKIEAEIEFINEKAKKMREGGGWEQELRKMGIDPANAELVDNSAGINLDDMNNVELNAKDLMGCGECNFIDGTGKETKCHTCGKPLRPIHTGI